MVARDQDDQLPFIPKLNVDGSKDEDIRNAKHDWRTTPALWERLLSLTLAITCLVLVIRQWCDCNHTHRLSEDRLSLESAYTPARDAVQYRWQPADSVSSWFLGQPDEQLEDRWNDIMAGSLLRVSDKDLKGQIAPEHVRLKEGGYAAGLSVSHHLHCVKRIKDHIWADRCDIPRDSQEYRELRYHADHCIDMLREHVMCYADPTLMKMRWFPHSQISGAPGIVQDGPKTCVNWERLHQWMVDHSTRTSSFVEPEDWNEITELYDDPLLSGPIE